MDLSGGLINLNSIPIYYEKSRYSLTKKEVNCIKKIEYYNTEPGLYLSISDSVLQNKELKNFKKFIVEKAEAYVKNILEIKNQIYLTQSWSTLSKTNASHRPHSHPNTFISLVYYAHAEEGKLFFDIRTSSLKDCFNFDYSISNYNIYNSEEWAIHVKSGDIVIFPGHICHGSTANKSKRNRITMGANFFLKGIIGTKKRLTLIKI